MRFAAAMRRVARIQYAEHWHVTSPRAAPPRLKRTNPPEDAPKGIGSEFSAANAVHCSRDEAGMWAGAEDCMKRIGGISAALACALCAATAAEPAAADAQAGQTAKPE